MFLLLDVEAKRVYHNNYFQRAVWSAAVSYTAALDNARQAGVGVGTWPTTFTVSSGWKSKRMAATTEGALAWSEPGRETAARRKLAA